MKKTLNNIKYCLANETASPSVEILIAAMIGFGLTAGLLLIKSGAHSLNASVINHFSNADSSFT